MKTPEFHKIDMLISAIGKGILGILILNIKKERENVVFVVT